MVKGDLEVIYSAKKLFTKFSRQKINFAILGKQYVATLNFSEFKEFV